MKGNRRRDSKPEIELRRLLYARGLRYRVDARALPELNRRADLVFHASKVAVYVHGCFWHGCSQHYAAPKANRAFWATKLANNVARDADTRRALLAAGWLPIEIWEHDDMAQAAQRVVQAVTTRRS